MATLLGQHSLHSRCNVRSSLPLRRALRSSSTSAAARGLRGAGQGRRAHLLDAFLRYRPRPTRRLADVHARTNAAAAITRRICHDE